MNQSIFDKIVEEQCQLIRQVLKSKGEEYSTEDDRLHNFKRAAALAATSPELAARGMLAKHIVSVWDMVDHIEAGRTPQDDSYVSEKIGDAINYLILLKALIRDRQHEAEKAASKRR